MKDCKILGVDPGTNLLGFAVLEVTNGEFNVQDFGVVNLSKIKDHQGKLKEIFLQLQEIIETYLPQHMAVEAPFYGKNPQSMLKLGRAQGVAMTAAITMGLTIHEYAPKRIKQAVTGNGNASKEQVSGMIKSIIKDDIKFKHLDASDALATALCHYFQMKSPMAAGKKVSGWGAFAKANPGRIKG